MKKLELGVCHRLEMQSLHPDVEIERLRQFLRLIAEIDNTPRTRSIAIAALCGDEFNQEKLLGHG